MLNLDNKTKDRIMRESSLVDPSKAVLIENHIDAHPVLTYVWRCPSCREMNFRLAQPDKQGCVACDNCKEGYSANMFDRRMLSEIKSIMENPDIILSGGNQNSHTNRNGIEATPMVRFIWQCPSCGTINPSIPIVKDGVIACVNSHCQMRYPYSAIKHDYNKQFDRLVTELKIPIYNY